MKEVWNVSFEYQGHGKRVRVVPWEYWDDLTFRTKADARQFAQRMKARPEMKDKKLRQVHYKRLWL